MTWIVMHHVPKIPFLGTLPGEMIATCQALIKCLGHLRCGVLR